MVSYSVLHPVLVEEPRLNELYNHYKNDLQELASQATNVHKRRNRVVEILRTIVKIVFAYIKDFFEPFYRPEYFHAFTAFWKVPRYFRAFTAFWRAQGYLRAFTAFWRVQTSVEHMAGKVFGGGHSVSIHKTLKVLQKTFPASCSELKQSLAYASSLQRRFLSVWTHILGLRSWIIDKVRRDVHSLAVGQQLFVPVQLSHHVVMMSLTCVGKDLSDRKLYKMSIYNTGDGLQYHSNLIDETGKQKYQVVFEIEDIPETTLCAPSSSFFQQSLSNKCTTQEFYEEALVLLGGKVAERSEDHRLWSHGQLSSSCGTGSVWALVRSQLSAKEYKELRFATLLNIFVKASDSVIRTDKKKWMLVVIACEMADFLKRKYRRQGLAFPAELEILSNRLVALECGPEVSCKETLSSVAEFGAMTETVYAFLQTVGWHHKELSDADTVIKTLCDCSERPLSLEEVRKGLQVGLQAEKDFGDDGVSPPIPLLFRLTALLSAIVASSTSVDSSLSIEERQNLEQVRLFHTDLCARCNGTRAIQRTEEKGTIDPVIVQCIQKNGPHKYMEFNTFGEFDSARKLREKMELVRKNMISTSP